MSDLTASEKLKIERALDMRGGYVLNFSNPSFSDFFHDRVGIDIYDPKYELGSGSKANRLRAFMEKESNYLVGKFLGFLIEDWEEFRGGRGGGATTGSC